MRSRLIRMPDAYPITASSYNFCSSGSSSSSSRSRVSNINVSADPFKPHFDGGNPDFCSEGKPSEGSNQIVSVIVLFGMIFRLLIFVELFHYWTVDPQCSTLTVEVSTTILDSVVG